MRRRDALVAAGLIGIAVSIPPLLRLRPPRFEFEDLPGLPGFRRLAQGPISAAPPVFAGLRTDAEAAADRALPDDLCRFIFGAEPWGDTLPLAVFSDFFCPFCAAFERDLLRLRENGAPVRLIFHELPLLGPRSRDLARVALAAGRQGKRDAVRRDLMQRGLRPGPAALTALAGRHGLDGARLQADVQSDGVAQELETALALGRRLGIPGTPASLVGRTLVIGAIEVLPLEALIALERAEPFGGCA